MAYSYSTIIDVLWLDWLTPRKIIISFIGIDGSGKSTVAKNLQADLTRKGIDSAYFHHSYELIEHMPKRLRRLLGGSPILEIQSTKMNENKKNHFSLFNSLFVLLVFLDAFVTFSIERILTFTHNFIIFDRYLFDNVISFFEKSSYAGCLFFNLVPKPDMTFLLIVSAEVAYRRKGEGSIELYEHQQMRYLDLVKNLDSSIVKVVDSNIDLGLLNTLILENVVLSIEHKRL